MSWIREHTKYVLEGLWRRHFSTPFVFKEEKTLVEGVRQWLKAFEVVVPKVKKSHMNSYSCTLIWDETPSNFLYNFDAILSGMGPGDDDGEEIPLRVGEKVTKLYPFIHNSFASLWGRLKPGGLLILPGRDAWVWFVMAKKFGVPAWDASRGEKIIPGVKGVIFDPRISRSVASDAALMRTIYTEWGLYKDEYNQNVSSLVKHILIFDTGFNGTVPRGMMDYSMLTWELNTSRWSEKLPVEWWLLSHADGDKQIFPSLHETRHIRKKKHPSPLGDWRRNVLDLENFPKHWVSCEKIKKPESSWAWKYDALQAENSHIIVVRALAVTLMLCTYKMETFYRTQRPYGGDKKKENVPWWGSERVKV